MDDASSSSTHTSALAASSSALSAAAKLLLAKAKYTMESTRSNELREARPNQVPEATLNGQKATELVCWFYVRGSGEGCTCAGSKAHIWNISQTM